MRTYHASLTAEVARMDDNHRGSPVDAAPIDNQLAVLSVEVARLEMRLILRNRTARYYTITCTMLVVMICGLMLSLPGTASSSVIDVLYTSALFAPLTYASLGFSWNATSGASLFHLPLAPKHHLAGRYLVALVMTAAATTVLVAFCAMWRPEFMLLPILSGLLALSAFFLPFLLVSVRTARNLDADAPPFSSFRRFGWEHYAALCTVVLPVYGASKFVSYDHLVVMLTIATLSATAALPFVAKYSVRTLEKNVPKLSDKLLHG